MNLAFSKVYCEKNIPIRLVGELSYFSFELLNVDDDSEILIKENELTFYINDIMKKITYFSDTINYDINLCNLLSKNRKPTLEDPVLIKTSFPFSNPKSFENFTTPVVTFTPISCDKKDLFKVNLSIDTLLFVPVESKLLDVFQLAILSLNEQILNFKKAYGFLNHHLKSHKINKIIALNYKLENSYILTLILPEEEMEEEKEWRRNISIDNQLKNTLQRCQALYPPNDVLVKFLGNGEKLINPHLKINATFRECHLVRGRYTYYHYLQDNFNDKGWGCAYRSLQTIASWFLWQGYSTVNIPSHKDIQMSLVKMGDKEKSFINSRSWIGSFEINLVLQDLFKIESRIISINKGSDLAGIYFDLQLHFSDGGAPVMIGGGQLAHTIIGISKDDFSKIRFLILDPHYTGLSNDLTSIINKGWCGWKELSFWNENLPYNLCLPMILK